MSVHPNSIDAWNRFPKSSRSYMVIGALFAAQCPQTDREVCTRLGQSDMNYVRPTITTLVRDGILEEVGVVNCPVTRRTVRLVGFPKPKQGGLFG